MSKISLRWRITILMGLLVLISTILLTAFSIQNMTNNFVVPLTLASSEVKKPQVDGENNNNFSFSIDGINSDLPKDVYYTPEINLDIDNARQIFSSSSYLYMALVIIGSMLIAYFLAGRAMRPISNFNDEIKAIDRNNLSKRVSIPQTKDEIESLSHSFNKLLAQLEQEFEKEKRFSANAAHELKTPLATIMTSAQVLQLNDQTTSEEYRENLDITLQSVKRLSSVIDGLLLLNRTDCSSSFEHVSLSQILCAIQKEIEPIYYEKRLILKQTLHVDALLGNPTLIYRAFFNLVENAYKYTDKNGIITITSSCFENEIVIQISDTGIGISKNDIANVFEPFYRADKSRSRKIAGAGLGLSITKEILNLHKASITIRSEKDCGTIVEVRIKNK